MKKRTKTSAKKVLGWKPTVELEDGLNQTIAYFYGDKE